MALARAIVRSHYENDVVGLHGPRQATIGGKQSLTTWFLAFMFVFVNEESAEGLVFFDTMYL